MMISASKKTSFNRHFFYSAREWHVLFKNPFRVYLNLKTRRSSWENDLAVRLYLLFQRTKNPSNPLCEIGWISE